MVQMFIFTSFCFFCLFFFKLITLQSHKISSFWTIVESGLLLWLWITVAPQNPAIQMSVTVGHWIYPFYSFILQRFCPNWPVTTLRLPDSQVERGQRDCEAQREWDSTRWPWDGRLLPAVSGNRSRGPRSCLPFSHLYWFMGQHMVTKALR